MKRCKIPSGVTRTMVLNAIDEYCFNERYRQILKRRLLDTVGFEPLAEEFDLSVGQVKNIVYKYGDKVLTHVSF